MEGRAAVGGVSLAFVFISVSTIILGFFWLFSGIGANDSSLVLQGTSTIMAGLAVGAVANFIKI